MNKKYWENPEIITWSQIILNSYKRLLKKELIDRNNDLLIDAKNLYFADFVVLSHNKEPDPIYNYGNEKALKLWEMDWQQLIKTPSRNTTEPISREERDALLREANLKGYITNYGGIRVSSTGKKYLIKDITLWNLTDEKGEYCGQAATFSHWERINN